jgi:ATP-dependent Clp protease adapter protein ClpS
MTEVMDRPTDVTEERRQYDNPATVVVYNCDCHTFEHVIEVLCKVCKMSSDKAAEKAIEVDRDGSSVVFQGEFEKAEVVEMNLRHQGHSKGSQGIDARLMR